MKTLKESLLDNIEDNIKNGQKVIDDHVNNVSTLPTVKSFEKGLYNKKWHQAIWYCPDVIKRYRSKYPDMIPDESDSIMIILDAGYGRVVDCNLYFTTRTINGMSKIRSISGWNDGFVGANLRKYKQMAIDILTKLAKNPDKMDAVMKYANDYRKYWLNNDDKDSTYMRLKSFNEI